MSTTTSATISWSPAYPNTSSFYYQLQQTSCPNNNICSNVWEDCSGNTSPNAIPGPATIAATYIPSQYTSFQVTGLAPTTQYFFRIRARFNSSGTNDGPWSAIKSSTIWGPTGPTGQQGNTGPTGSASVTITDTSANTLFYPTFVGTTGTTGTFNISAISPFSINPGSGDFNFHSTIKVQGLASGGSVGIGYAAGQTGQQQYAVAVGNNAGVTNQGAHAVALGDAAGYTGQGQYATAIGFQAGEVGQGQYATAIGYQAGKTSQHNNTIILSGLTSELNSTQSNSFYVAPINGGVTGPNMLFYNTSTYEITYGAKSFVIDHPLDAANKYLVHTCLEGPEVGVYYRGKGEIVNGTSVVIYLPDYFGALCNGSGDATVQVTHIYDGKVKVFSASEVDLQSNTFTVYGENGRFNWLVHGKRGNIRVECDKSTTNVKGDGPYKYIV